MLSRPIDEILVPFPNGVSRDAVPIATSFRSTWLASSLRSLRERGLLDRYLANLPAEFHEPVLTSVAGVWLPTKVATAHYEACERLGLSEALQLAMGAEVGKHAQGTVFGTAVRLAKGPASPRGRSWSAIHKSGTASGSVVASLCTSSDQRTRGSKSRVGRARESPT